jgi:hypothetical protein
MNNEEKRKQLQKLWKIILGGLVCLAVGPFALLIVGLGPAILLSWVIIQFLPWFSASIANWRLKALKAEAARNPVETLQNGYIQQQQKLAEARKAIVTFKSEIESYASELSGFKKQFPQDSLKFEATLTKMRQLYDFREDKYHQAKHQLDAKAVEIEKAEAIWKMAKAAEKLHQTAGMTEQDFLAKIMEETALASVDNSLNAAIAELDLSLAEEVEKAGPTPKLVADKRTTVSEYLTASEMAKAN